MVFVCIFVDSGNSTNTRKNCWDTLLWKNRSFYKDKHFIGEFSYTFFSTMPLIISLAWTSMVIKAPKMLLVNFGISPRTKAASWFRLVNDFCSKAFIASMRSSSVVRHAVTSWHHIVWETVRITCAKNNQKNKSIKSIKICNDFWPVNRLLKGPS